jgi:hypothetical protein
MFGEGRVGDALLLISNFDPCSQAVKYSGWRSEVVPPQRHKPTQSAELNPLTPLQVVASFYSLWTCSTPELHHLQRRFLDLDKGLSDRNKNNLKCALLRDGGQEVWEGTPAGGR